MNRFTFHSISKQYCLLIVVVCSFLTALSTHATNPCTDIALANENNCPTNYGHINYASTVNTPINISVQINNDDDDVEEKNHNGELDFTSSDIELIRDNTVDQTVGLRFNGIDIPQGATITDAYIQFTVDETDSGTANVTFKAEAHNDAPAFSNSNYNISNRTTTNASVGWDIMDWTTVGEAGADQRTPDLSAIVQEIVDRSGWTANNSVVFIVTGSGERTAESYNGSPTDAPTLHVTYTPSNPCDPHVDVDGDGSCSDVDCDDSEPLAYPGATEVCDGIDNNCDGQVDEGLSNDTYFGNISFSSQAELDA